VPRGMGRVPRGTLAGARSRRLCDARPLDRPRRSPRAGGPVSQSRPAAVQREARMGGGGGARRLRGRRQRRIGGTPVPVAAHARVPDGAQRGGAAGDLASTSARSELPAGVPVGRTPHRPPAGVHRHRAAPRARSKCRRSRGRDARCPRERRARGRDPALVGRTGPARQRLGLQDRSSASRGRTSMDAAGFLGRRQGPRSGCSTPTSTESRLRAAG